MQKVTGTAEGDLRASQGGLYPPWSLMLSHIIVWGVFSFGFGPWVTICEKRGLKTHQIYFILSFWWPGGCANVLWGVDLSGREGRAQIYGAGSISDPLDILPLTRGGSELVVFEHAPPLTWFLLVLTPPPPPPHSIPLTTSPPPSE
jgi:hypothetical protein